MTVKLMPLKRLSDSALLALSNQATNLAMRLEKVKDKARMLSGQLKVARVAASVLAARQKKPEEQDDAS